MRIPVQISQSPSAHGKRPLEVVDSQGSGSTKFKLRRCRPIDSTRHFPSFCGPSDGVEKEADAADQGRSRPTTESAESNRNPVEIGGDSDQDDDCLIIDEEPKSPEQLGFEWVEEEDHNRDQNRVDEPEDFSIAGGDAAGEEDDGQNADIDESEDSAGEEDDDECRKKVQEVREMFQDLYKKLALEYEQERNGGPITKRVASKAAMILRKEKKCLNTKATFGPVPGVKIGDRFKFRSEIAVVGLHNEFNNGISSTRIGDKDYAVSVVDAGRYNNRSKNANVLVYSGHGGNVDVRARCSKDQTLEGGNLALKNSIDARYPVRVIRKIEVKRHTYEYFYDGLYNVVKIWPETSDTGKVAYMFEMVRIEGQPKVDFFVKRRTYSKKSVS